MPQIWPQPFVLACILKLKFSEIQKAIESYNSENNRSQVIEMEVM